MSAITCRLNRTVNGHPATIAKLAYFIDKLANPPDGDGTLLDHSLILWAAPPAVCRAEAT